MIALLDNFSIQPYPVIFKHMSLLIIIHEYDIRHCICTAVGVTFVQILIRLNSIVLRKMDEYNPENIALIEFLEKAVHKELIKLNKNDCLFRENEDADAVYFIKSGRVKLIRTDKSRKCILLHIARDGDVLGIQAVITKHPHSNSAVALSETTVYRITRSDFNKIVDQDIRYKLAFMRLLCSKIGFLEEKIGSRKEKSTSERLANTFISFYKTYGIDKNNCIDLDLPLQDMANMVGTSKEYLNKKIHEFIKNGLISFVSGKYRILDPGKLEKIAQTKQLING